MEKLFALILVLAALLSVAALAEVDTSTWVEMPVGESGYAILVPDDMVEAELDGTEVSWTEKNLVVYRARCEGLEVEIGKFDGITTLEDAKDHMTAEVEQFESVEINEDGVLDCLGADDMVYVVCVGNEESGIYCLTISPLEKDPDSEEFDISLGVEMSDIVRASLKPVDAE